LTYWIVAFIVRDLKRQRGNHGELLERIRTVRRLLKKIISMANRDAQGCKVNTSCIDFSTQVENVNPIYPDGDLHKLLIIEAIDSSTVLARHAHDKSIIF
jgi:hypothetical protein